MERIAHGLYRLPHWPIGAHDELLRVQTIAPFRTLSLDTALTLLGLTDMIPSTIHLTIPETSRPRSLPDVTLHRSRQGAMTDRTLRDGLWVSTARRALLDAAREGAAPRSNDLGCPRCPSKGDAPDDVAELSIGGWILLCPVSSPSRHER